MGTNYYVDAGDGHEKHFGKESYQWDFALRVYPDEGIYRLEDWLFILTSKDTEVRNEYLDKIKLKPLLRKVLGLDRTAMLKPLPQKDAVINPFTDRLRPASPLSYRASAQSKWDAYYCINRDFC
tara:strand:+ start:711 stop:1082 length:372 start_codon:yes stop_codon:yes gene_type:complete